MVMFVESLEDVAPLPVLLLPLAFRCGRCCQILGHYPILQKGKEVENSLRAI